MELRRHCQSKGTLGSVEANSFRYDTPLRASLPLKFDELMYPHLCFFLVALAIIVAVAFVNRRMARLKTESKRTGELVQIALDTLRNQEIAHHTDPVTAPHPYLSSLQLRDLILQDEHSIPIRRRLWDQVERVVEGNANVRTNMEEVEGGDELRVWRWVGSNRGRRADGDADDSVLYASPRTPVEQS
jgi:hypothetical protein